MTLENFFFLLIGFLDGMMLAGIWWHLTPNVVPGCMIAFIWAILILTLVAGLIAIIVEL